MELKTGSTVTIRNLTTRETALFQIQRLTEYMGGVIVSGTTQQHGVRGGGGLVVVRSRPGCWAYLPHQDASTVVRFCDLLRGLPLAMIEDRVVGVVGGVTTATEQIGHPILNWGYVPALGQLPGSPDGQVALARRVVDAYRYWQAHGQLPLELRPVGSFSS